MANITDSTYFEKGSLYIPNNKNISALPTGTPTNQTELDFYITQYERELLLDALGITLYDELQLALVDLPGSDQKWQDLVEGVTYVNSSSVSKRWDGLQGFNKQSVIAFYIYTEYLRNYNETFTTVGTVKNNAKNATNYDATPKYIKAHISFIEQYQSDTTSSPTIRFNEFGSVGIDWYGSEKVTVSLYQYLLDSNELDDTSFPDFENYFKFYVTQNSKGF
jgi:hypothetical protein